MRGSTKETQGIGIFLRTSQLKKTLNREREGAKLQDADDRARDLPQVRARTRKETRSEREMRKRLLSILALGCAGT